MIARALLFIAGLLAVAVARKRAEHIPVAVLLLSVVLLDSLRDLFCEPAPRADMLLYLAVPALSAWCAVRVLTDERWSWLLVNLSAALLLTTFDASWWTSPSRAEAASCFVQAVAALVWSLKGARLTLPAAACLIMLTGDLLRLLGPAGLGGPWWVSNAQTGAVAIAVALLQAAWLARDWARTRWASGVLEGVLLEYLRALGRLHVWRAQRRARARVRSSRG